MANRTPRFDARTALPPRLKGTMVAPTKRTIEVFDVSRTGVAFTCSEPLKTGAVVELRFELPGESLPVEIVGEVRRRIPKGFAMKTLRLTETAHRAIERVISTTK